MACVINPARGRRTASAPDQAVGATWGRTSDASTVCLGSAPTRRARSTSASDPRSTGMRAIHVGSSSIARAARSGSAAVSPSRGRCSAVLPASPREISRSSEVTPATCGRVGPSDVLAGGDGAYGGRGARGANGCRGGRYDRRGRRRGARPVRTLPAPGTDRTGCAGEGRDASNGSVERDHGSPHRGAMAAAQLTQEDRCRPAGCAPVGGDEQEPQARLGECRGVGAGHGAAEVCAPGPDCAVIGRHRTILVAIALSCEMNTIRDSRCPAARTRTAVGSQAWVAATSRAARSARYRSASSAAWHPEPAAVMAWR